MSGTRGVRPPVVGEPDERERARLVEGLRVAVFGAHARAVRGPGGRRVLVRAHGERTQLLHAAGDQVLGERDVDTRALIEQLSEQGQTYSVLRRVIDDPSRSS